MLQLKNTEIYEVRYAEVKERVAELADRGFSLIIGDVPSVNAAMANGLRGLLILSSEDCIRQSVIAAIYYSELMEKGQEITQIFQTVIDNLKFRIILMDQIGNVIVDNRAFEITDHQTFKKSCCYLFRCFCSSPPIGAVKNRNTGNRNYRQKGFLSQSGLLPVLHFTDA